METLHPREIELGLDRVVVVRDRLGLSPPPFTVITVGGTNGKGSTVAMLEHVLQSAGYRVGAYTSPHLVHFNERVRIGTHDAGDADLVAAFERVEAARRKVPLTYFEFGTLAAVDLFRQQSVDIAILEVGLGGRLDAVNAWDADVSVVASVGIDHTEWLGPDRESIGREKAGIFRAGRPAICGDKDPPHSLVEHAATVGARLLRLGRDFDFDVQADGWTWRSVDRVYAGLPFPSMRGDIQMNNASCALMALECLADRFPATVADRRMGLTQAVLPGRFQTLPGRPIRVFDVAHNAQAAQALARTLRAQIVPGRTLAVCAMLRDKPMRDVVSALIPLVARWHVAGLDGSRGSTGDDLRQALTEAGANDTVEVHDSVEQAYASALSEASEQDRVVVLGSFHTVGVILRQPTSKAGVMAERKNSGDEFNPRHRIVGAVILVALAVIFLPMLLSDRAPPVSSPAATGIPVPESRSVAPVPAPSKSADPGPRPVPQSGTRVVTVPIEPIGSAPSPSAEPAQSVVPPAPKSTAAVPGSTEPAAKSAPKTEPKAESPPPKAASAPVAKASPSGKGWIVQVGVFSHPDNARRLQERIRKKGYTVRLDPSVPVTGKPVRVEVGIYRRETDARAAATRIQKEFGIHGLVRQN